MHHGSSAEEASEVVAAIRQAESRTKPPIASQRGPTRSAIEPVNSPRPMYTKPQRENTSDTSARDAPNSPCSELKNAENEYVTPKIRTSAKKLAATTIQP